MFVHTFSPIQSPGLNRLSDLNLANITSGLESCCIVRWIFRGFSLFIVFMLCFGQGLRLVFAGLELFACCLLISVGLLVLAMFLLLFFLGLPDNLFISHTLTVFTSVLHPCLCCCRLLQFSFFFWYRSNSFILSYWTRFTYVCSLLGVLVFLFLFLVVRFMYSWISYQLHRHRKINLPTNWEG